MGFLSNLLSSAQKTVSSYTGDKVFLKAGASAAANITLADGKMDDSEQDAAVAGLMGNAILKGSFTPAEIEAEYNDALARAKTRAGRAENTRFIEAMMSRPVEQRQDIFYIAADVADSDEIGDDERRMLDNIAKALGGLDAAKLLSV